jgi:polar amino acid transport system substrate-binding protein
MMLRFIVSLFIYLTPISIAAGSYKASLAQMPIHAESSDEGVFVELVKAIALEWGEEVDIRVYPFIRSMKNVIEDEADFHIPLIKNDLIPEEDLPYLYSTETLLNVNFVLYTTRDIKQDLKKLRVESDRAHIKYFPFPVMPSSNISSSLKMLSLGRIDAYIFADTATDPVLKKLNLTNIRRSLYKTFEEKVIRLIWLCPKRYKA